MDRYDWRKEVDREFNHQTAKAKGGKMRFVVIVTEDGCFVPQGVSGLHQLVLDGDVGATLRKMAGATAQEKPKRTYPNGTRRRKKAELEVPAA